MKWVLNESDSAKALAIRRGFVSQVHELLAPDVFPIEVAHALARAERKNVLISPQGTAALMTILRTLPQLFDSLSLLPRAFEIASKARIGVYDCLYIALAEREKCDFITADLRLVHAGVYARAVDLSTIP